MSAYPPFESTHMVKFERLCRKNATHVEREIALMDAFTEAVDHIHKLERVIDRLKKMNEK